MKVKVLVEVLWLDAINCAMGTHSLEEAQAHSVAKARTVGYLLKQDKEKIVLGMTDFYDTDLPPNEIPEEGFRFIWVIPRGCVTAIKILKTEGEE